MLKNLQILKLRAQYQVNKYQHLGDLEDSSKEKFIFVFKIGR